jgi:uncharacterized phage protein (TIGR02220 family)
MSNERLLFKFYKSYFDVAQELNDKDRLAFYDALMKRQFLGIETELTGISKLAYISQKHNIDAQIKGWEDKTKLSLSNTNQGGMQGGYVEPSIQVEVKEEEEVELLKPTSIKVDWNALINQFNLITGKKTKVISPIVKNKILARLKEGYSKQDFLNAIENCYNDKWHKETNHKHLTLEFISRPDKLERFSTQK